MTSPTGQRAAAGPMRVRRIALTQHWLPDRPERALLCFEDADGHAGGAFAVCTAETASDALAQRIEEGEALDLHAAAEGLAAPVFDPAAPVPLEPVRVAKSWGEEIWFTGIEARGVVRAGRNGRTVPLPWLLAARPDAFAGVAAPILVKVLAPSACADTGDLYFEVHREKEEVYVVTAVDPEAWPDGWGRVRYGFDARAREALGEEGFRMAFRTAARANARAQQSLGPAGAAAPAAALASARRARVRLDTFTNTRGIEAGDVVRVPPGLPHGLMRGVRVVEFQTPSYERQVLYANQALAPADAAALDAALPSVRMDVPADPRPVEMETTAGVRSACIARMRDFEVHRYRLEPGAATPLPRAPYGVLVGMAGTLACGGTPLGIEEAALLSGQALLRRLEGGDAGGTALLAIPA